MAQLHINQSLFPLRIYRHCERLSKRSLLPQTHDFRDITSEVSLGTLNRYSRYIDDHCFPFRIGESLFEEDYRDMFSGSKVTFAELILTCLNHYSKTSVTSINRLEIKLDRVEFFHERNRRITQSVARMNAVSLGYIVSMMKKYLGDRFDAHQLTITMQGGSYVPSPYDSLTSIPLKEGLLGIRINFPMAWLYTEKFVQIGIDNPNSKLSVIRNHCRQNLQSPNWCIHDLATALGTSVRTLQRLLAEEGTSFKTVLVEEQISKAKALLESTSMRIYEVAEAVGFIDPSSFTRAFKKQCAIGPAMYRKQLSAG